MKTLTLSAIILASASMVNAQSFSISVPLNKAVHPIHAWKQATPAQRFMFLTNMGVQALNVADAYTTYRGVIVGQYCEENPLLQTGPCAPHNISAWRFGFAKAGIAAFALAEYVPTWTRPRSEGYYVFWGIVNIGGSIPLALADVGNIKVLSGN